MSSAGGQARDLLPMGREARSKMPHLIVDCDPGVDDAHALAMALTRPDTQVAAVTTVAGNVDVEKTTANALFIVSELRAEVPVYAGAAAPLVEPFHGAPEVHGADGLGLLPRDAPILRAKAGFAADAIVELARQRPNVLTLVALGPLTNLALALQRAPDLPSLFRGCVVCGGAIQAKGNFTSFAEFNVASDPEAAEMVFSSWPGLTLVPWETVLGLPATAAEADLVTAGPSPAATLIRRINTAHSANVGFLDDSDGVLFPDQTAMAVALDARCIAEDSFHAIEVSLSSGDRRGETMVDWQNAREGRPRHRIVTRLDGQRTLKLIGLAVSAG
jgi:purine nucleosidase